MVVRSENFLGVLSPCVMVLYHDGWYEGFDICREGGMENEPDTNVPPGGVQPFCPRRRKVMVRYDV